MHYFNFLFLFLFLGLVGESQIFCNIEIMKWVLRMISVGNGFGIGFASFFKYIYIDMYFTC